MFGTIIENSDVVILAASLLFIGTMISYARIMILACLEE